MRTYAQISQRLMILNVLATRGRKLPPQELRDIRGMTLRRFQWMSA
jgi:hypothetical protein